jgi:hypothetical protein
MRSKNIAFPFTAASQTAAATANLSPKLPQCQTSVAQRLFMVFTGTQIYGSNGTAFVFGRSGAAARGVDLVWFHRNKVLPNMADGYAVKAILAHDAIVHPDHPLRIEGKPGIELTIGEVANYIGIRHNQQPTTNNLSFRYSGEW